MEENEWEEVTEEKLIDIGGLEDFKQLIGIYDGYSDKDGYEGYRIKVQDDVYLLAEDEGIDSKFENIKEGQKIKITFDYDEDEYKIFISTKEESE